MEWLIKALKEHGVELSAEVLEAVKQAAKDQVVAKSELDTAAKTAESLKAQLAQRDADMADLKKNTGDNEDLKKQFSDLQTKYQAETKAAAAELAQTRLHSAIDVAVMGAGARNAKAVKALLDMEKVTLDGERLLGLSDQLETLKKDQGYLFAEPGGGSQPSGYNYQPKGGNPPAGDEPLTMQQVIAAEMTTRMGQKQ